MNDKKKQEHETCDKRIQPSMAKLSTHTVAFNRRRTEISNQHQTQWAITYFGSEKVSFSEYEATFVTITVGLIAKNWDKSGER